MKKLITGILLAIMLSGCSLIGEVTNSIDYTKEATEYINQLSDFAEEAPQLIQNAKNDSAAKEEIKNKFDSLKEDMEAFNSIDAPSIAKDLHQNIVDKNEVLLDEINTLIENGQLAVDKLENSEVVKTINEVTKLLDRIENLGL